MGLLRRGAAVAALAFVVSACSGGAGGARPPGSAGGSSSPAAAPTHTSGAPTSTASRSPDPSFDFGQQVFIEAAAVRPQWLVSVVNRAVVFVNDSGGGRIVVFENVNLRSTVIPPGGTWTYRPTTTISIVYHLVGGPSVTGRIQVTQLEP
ncbi:MAG TPA: hypothetical protein VID47_00050 [Actinomycetota bacterium]|jgi:hypothetical protein